MYSGARGRGARIPCGGRAGRRAWRARGPRAVGARCAGGASARLGGARCLAPGPPRGRASGAAPRPARTWRGSGQLLKYSSQPTSAHHTMVLIRRKNANSRKWCAGRRQTGRAARPRTRSQVRQLAVHHGSDNGNVNVVRSLGAHLASSRGPTTTLSGHGTCLRERGAPVTPAADAGGRSARHAPLDPQAPNVRRRVHVVDCGGGGVFRGGGGGRRLPRRRQHSGRGIGGRDADAEEGERECAQRRRRPAREECRTRPLAGDARKRQSTVAYGLLGSALRCIGAAGLSTDARAGSRRERRGGRRGRV
jgi:hypothetical protein